MKLEEPTGRTRMAIRQRWPLVGRSEELRLALTILSGRNSGSLVIAGPAGVGKTRLVAEVGDALRRRGWVVREVTVTRGAAAIPFGPIANLLRAGEMPSDQLEFLFRAERILLDEAESRRLALVVDDAHLLDPGSAALIHQLASSHRLVILATVRSGSPAPDAVTAIWKDELATRLDLIPLAPDEVERLLCKVLGGHIEGKTLRDLIQTSNGNVLFLRELVHAGLTSGALSRDRGVWYWSGPISLAGGLLDLIQERLRALGSAERMLTTGLALGEPLEIPVLEQIGSKTDIDVVAAAGLVVFYEQGRRVFARLAHPLYADAVRKDASALDIRLLSARLADAIRDLGGRRAEDTLRIVVLRLAAGQSLPLRVALPAARRALDSGDHELGERIARAALEAGAGFPATMLLAQALTYLRRETEADQLLAALPLGADPEISSLARWRAWNLAYGLGRVEEAEQVLAVAESQIGETRWRDDVVATRAMFLMSDLRLPEAIRLASAVVERAAASPTSLTDAYSAGIHALWAHGRPESGVKLAKEGRSAMIRPGEDFGVADNTLLYGHFRALLFAGSMGEAGELATTTYRRAVESRWARSRPYWAYCIGLHSFCAGRAQTALEWLQEANLRPMYADPAFIRLSATATLAMAAILVGESALSASALKDLASLREGYPVNHAWVKRARAWDALSAGELDRGLAMLDDAASDCRAGEYHAMEAVLLHDVARFGSPGNTVARLTEIAAASEGVLFNAFANHASALADEDAPGLEEAGSVFARIGLNLEAAEAFAAAARIHQLGGSRGLAAICRQRAHSSLMLCEGAQSPALVGMDVSATLSKRELEIGTLAARGLSTSEIASRLSLSGRTVENHLQHVFDKLEVHSRLELAAALGFATSGHASPVT